MPHSTLDTLLNDGNDTTATLDGAHDGSDDARSVIANGYTLVLPTIAWNGRRSTTTRAPLQTGMTVII